MERYDLVIMGGAAGIQCAANQARDSAVLLGLFCSWLVDGRVPRAAIVRAVLGLNLFGDALNDLFDPRRR